LGSAEDEREPGNQRRSKIRFGRRNTVDAKNFMFFGGFDNLCGGGVLAQDRRSNENDPRLKPKPPLLGSEGFGGKNNGKEIARRCPVKRKIGANPRGRSEGKAGLKKKKN